MYPAGSNVAQCNSKNRLLVVHSVRYALYNHAMRQRSQSVRESSTYYWDRHFFHLSAASIIPLLGLAIGYEYALGMAIIGAAILVSGEAARFLIPSVNVWFIEWLGMLLKPGEESKVTAATYLGVTSVVILLVFEL